MTDQPDADIILRIVADADGRILAESITRAELMAPEPRFDVRERLVGLAAKFKHSGGVHFQCSRPARFWIQTQADRKRELPFEVVFEEDKQLLYEAYRGMRLEIVDA